MSTKCNDLVQRLSRAKEALENIMLGRQARVIVDQNGERVEFSAINLPRLNAYIASLESQLASCLDSRSTSPNAPVRYFF